MGNKDVKHIPYKIEKRSTNLLQSKLKKGSYPSVIFDLGANIGNYTIALSRAFPKSKIYSFEPVHETFEILKKNVEEIDNVTIFNFGFFNENKKNVPIGVPDIPDNIQQTFGRMTIHYDGDPIDTIELRKFSEWCIENDIYPNVMKIDIEGCEYQVLLDAIENKILDKVDAIYIEINPSFNDSPKIAPLLEEFGYKHHVDSKINRLFYR